VRLDDGHVTTWIPVAPKQVCKLRPRHERVLDRAGQTRRIAAEVGRIRARRLRASSRG